MDGISQARIDFDSSERFDSLRRPLGITGFGLNQMTLQPGQRGRIHRHRTQEEVYVVLRGTLTITLEADRLEAGEGDVVRVAPEVRRQLANLGRERCVLLAMGAAGTHEGRDAEAYGDWSETAPRAPQEVPLPADLPPADG